MNIAEIDITRQKAEFIRRALDPDDPDIHTIIENETDFREHGEWLATAIRRLRFQQASVAEEAKDIKVRKDRIEGRLEFLQNKMKQLMESAGEKQFWTPGATFSVSYPTRGKTVITDIALVPDKFCRITLEPKKELIREALLAGDDVPGAMLGNPEPNLIVRMK